VLISLACIVLGKKIEYFVTFRGLR